MTYTSQLTYNPGRIMAAAVYCSDGRVGQHFDDFLSEGLGLPRYDRVALPGGPACLARHVRAYVTEQGVLNELKFLIEAHGVGRVLLLAHQNCAFYSARLHLEGEVMEAQQRADLAKAGRLIYQTTGVREIEGYFARIVDDHISFEPVEFDPSKMV